MLIKIGLNDIPPLTFAGLRYSLAFVCLAGYYLISGRKHQIALHRLPAPTWARLIALGLFFTALHRELNFWGWPTCQPSPSTCCSA